MAHGLDSNGSHFFERRWVRSTSWMSASRTSDGSSLARVHERPGGVGRVRVAKRPKWKVASGSEGPCSGPSFEEVPRRFEHRVHDRGRHRDAPLRRGRTREVYPSSGASSAAREVCKVTGMCLSE